MQTKTNVIRLLEAASLKHRVITYQVDDDLSGETVAKKTGFPPEQVFKTLVAKGDKGNIAVFCIPVSTELDLKKAANVCKSKKIEMLPLRDLLPTTGYVRGGCSPIGMKKHYPSFIDETCVLYDEIAISGGARGVQIIASPSDIAGFAELELADLT